MERQAPQGRTTLRAIAAGPVAAGVVPILLFEGLRRVPGLDPSIIVPVYHFYIASAASLLAAAAAILIGIAARRRRNVQVSLVALAFLTLAVLFALHGLATPGFMLPDTALPHIAAHLCVFLSSAILCLSTNSRITRFFSEHLRWYDRLVPAWAGILFFVVGFSLWRPYTWDWLPVHTPPLNGFVSLTSIVLALVAAVRYWQAYAYTRLYMPLALVYASVWLAAVQWIMLNGQPWRMSWWIYHFLLVGVAGAVVVGVVRNYTQGGSLIAAVQQMLLADPRERLEAGFTDSVRALVLAVETRDPYTAGHTYRVTYNALLIGERMGLSPEQMRALVQGGLLHDVGKIEVPDHILNKPGKLTPEERAIIERHPVTGYEMCRRLGFMREELEVIRHHHERWDGTGYPDGLAGEDIPLLARILGVADVYDALTSRRSYREPWTHEQAHAFLLEQAGRQFDPRCIKAWEEVVASKQLAVDGTIKSPLLQ